jgi:hypothetical protein
MTDNVHIKSNNADADCQKAIFWADSNLLVLEIEPVVYLEDQIMWGDFIEIVMEGSLMRSGVIRGHAKIVSQDTTYRDELTGQRMVFESETDSTRKVIVFGQATSLYHIKREEEEQGEDGLNRVLGDRIILYFKNKQLHRIKIESSPGLSLGTYRSLQQQNSDSLGRRDQ